MLRNYFLTALRNLSRNRLYAGASIAGLAIGFAAALLIAVFIRDEHSYDRWIPDHERVFHAVSVITLPGESPTRGAATPPALKRVLETEFPQIEAVARMSGGNALSAVRRGDISATEQPGVLQWVDPAFFEIFRFPPLAGDPTRALASPDAVVLTRSMARKYFGRDAPLGEVIEIDKQPMRVAAVIEDLPSQSHLIGGIFASGEGPSSGMRASESGAGPLSNNVITYVKLKPGASVTGIAQRMGDVLETRLPPGPLGPGEIKRDVALTAIAEIHLGPSIQNELKPTGDRTVIAGLATVGVLIVMIAGVNFVTLMTARAGRRSVEVGVRKAAGATRRDLVVQFVGETFLYVAFAALLAVALAELLLPAANALTQRRMAFDYLGEPALLAGLAAVTLLVAALAGAYPALILAGFRPAAVLKGGVTQDGRSGGRLRQALVVFQFSVLIGLIVLAATIYRQTSFAVNEGMRLDADQMLLVYAQPCTPAIRDAMGALSGVEGAACGSAFVYEFGNTNDTVRLGGKELSAEIQPVDFGFLELYGLTPVAGRFFDAGRPADSAEASAPVVINETAARRLGFSDPAQAVGKTLLNHFDPNQVNFDTWPPQRGSEIIGVAPDFTFGSVRAPIEPTLYFAGAQQPLYSSALSVKLDGRSVPETLKTIDETWRRIGDGRPMFRVFVEQATLRHYVNALVEGAVIAVCSIIALSIACLGLFALSAYTAERRTKEIGIRKALGASSGDVLKLLIWQFSRPVLIANLIAWPIAFLAARHWLEGFAYRVEIAPWTFVSAGGAALLIAWSTVFVHALKVARAKPVRALRYE